MKYSKFAPRAVTRAPWCAATSDTAPLPQPTSRNVRPDSAMRDTVRHTSIVEKNSFGGNTPTGTAMRSPRRRDVRGLDIHHAV